MNEFGVPMNDAEISMLPNPGKAMLQEQLATSGMEQQWVGALVGAAVGVAGSIIGGNKAASAAEDQANAQNEAAYRRHQYDMEMWGMKKQQLQAQREESIDNILARYKDEGKIRAYNEAANEKRYQYDLKIKQSQELGDAVAFQRSEDIYTDTTNLNAVSAKAAMESEITKFQLVQDENRYDANEAYLEQLQAEGELRARLASGGTARKATQTTLADYGRQMEMLSASEESTKRNTREVLKEILRDKYSADISAYAAKMLKPGVLPDPIRPEPIPIPELVLPRILGDYDFGPEPVVGALADPGAAASAVWGNTITSIAGSVGGAFASTSGSKPFGWKDW